MERTKLLKRATLITVVITITLFTVSWLVGHDAISEFTGAAGTVMVVVSGVMAFIWYQEMNKASRNNSSSEGK